MGHRAHVDGREYFVTYTPKPGQPDPKPPVLWPGRSPRRRQIEHKLLGYKVFALVSWVKATGGIPDGWYLHVENGQRYGLYRSGTGTVDPDLLPGAMREVAWSDLPDATRERVIARARSIAIEHGISVR